MRVFLFLLFLIGLSTTPAANVAAADWMKQPTIWWSEISSRRPLSFACSGAEAFVTVMPQRRTAACLYGALDSPRVAVYQEGDGTVSSAISFPGGNLFYRLSVCQKVSGCLYAHKTDTLYVWKRIGDRSIFAYYTDTLANLKKGLGEDLLPVFSTSVQERHLFYDYSSAPRRSSIGLSSNGRWLVTEVYQGVFAVIDLVEYTTRIVTNVVIDFAPQIYELAITNDGTTLALLGDKGGSLLVDVRQCGSYTSKLTAQELGLCPSIRLRAAESMDEILYAPRFSTDTGRLSLRSRHDDERRIIIHAHDYVLPAQIDFIALGDSFTSGEGETSNAFYQSFTDTLHERCHTSKRSYPYLVGQTAGLRTASVACSGATMQDILANDLYIGQADRLGKRGSKLSTEQLSQARLDALDQFIPGRRSQQDFIEFYVPHLVTIGIGGNDAGFMTKLKSCVSPGTCEWAIEANRPRTAKEILGLYDKFVELYTTLSSLVPQAKVHAIGYPKVISREPQCLQVTGVLLNEAERRYIDEALTLLNRVIRSAAMTTGIGFVTNEEAFQGHVLCDLLSVPAMNGIRFGNDFGPISSLPIIGAESFHPTPFGHTLLADKVLAVARGNISVNNTSLTMTPSPYWGSEVAIDEAIHQVVAYNMATVTESSINVYANDFNFAPLSPVRIELHSDVQYLGTFIANDKGGIEIAIPLAGLPEGQHTLHLIGSSYEGNDVDRYQEVLIPAKLQAAPIAQTSQADISGVGPMTISPQVLGRDVGYVEYQTPIQPQKQSNAPLIALIIGIIALMSIRTIVKRLVPKRLFRTIEPFGHLVEAVLANIRYGFPARKLRIIGVTGTNGKTTTSFLIHRLLHDAGVNVALTTTVGYGIGNDITLQTEHITTAQSGILQRRLRDFAEAGVEWVVVETSSHALAQHRVWGIPYEIAVLTNLTHDHLDYHGTFENYRNAKRRLFQIANRHGMRFGVVNADDPSASVFRRSIKNGIEYGIKGGELRATNVSLESDHSIFTVKTNDETYKLRVNIPGEFNVSNALAALSVGRELGLSVDAIEKGIAALKGVEGRMNPIDEGQDFKVIVDFASTPDGFEKFFASMRPLVKGKLIAVFGSAGRRDEAKRATQGAIAGKYADIVVATEEDDRDEDGQKILKQIASGATKAGKKEGKSLFLIGNREEAIGFAMTLATTAEDTVVLLGKGHEKTIERADGEYPWSDSEVARTAIQALLAQKKRPNRASK